MWFQGEVFQELAKHSENILQQVNKTTLVMDSLFNKVLLTLRCSVLYALM